MEERLTFAKKVAPFGLEENITVQTVLGVYSMPALLFQAVGQQWPGYH
jgi:hypothetical protein